MLLTSYQWTLSMPRSVICYQQKLLQIIMIIIILKLLLDKFVILKLIILYYKFIYYILYNIVYIESLILVVGDISCWFLNLISIVINL